jgi:hypothetical protein
MLNHIAVKVLTKLNNVFFHQFLITRLRMGTIAPVLCMFIKKGISWNKQEDWVIESVENWV